MAYPDSVAQVTPAPGGTLAGNDPLKKLAIDNKLRLKMTLDEIFENFASPVIKDPDGMEIPNSIFMRFNTTPEKGAQRMTCALTTPYVGDFQIGDVYVPGTEAKDELRHFTMYYGEYAYAVAKDTFGRVKNEMDMYNVYETQTPKIAHYLSEQRGLRIREALLETIDHVTAGDAANSGLVAQGWNPNWYIAGADPAYGGAATDDFGQPIFDANSDFEDVISDVLGQASGADETAADLCRATFKTIRRASWYARLQKNIEKMDDGTYKMTLPSTQVEWLKDTDKDGGATYLTQYDGKDGDVVRYVPKIGRVGDVELYSDDRYPVITRASGAVGTGTALTVAYCAAGGVDGRTFTPNLGGGAAANTQWDISFLMGKAAVAEWEVDPVHYETEKANYGKREGNGAFGASGYSLVQYDNDAGYTTPSANRINIGSMVVAFASPRMA